MLSLPVPTFAVYFAAPLISNLLRDAARGQGCDIHRSLQCHPGVPWCAQERAASGDHLAPVTSLAILGPWGQHQTGNRSALLCSRGHCPLCHCSGDTEGSLGQGCLNAPGCCLEIKSSTSRSFKTLFLSANAGECSSGSCC